MCALLLFKLLCICLFWFFSNLYVPPQDWCIPKNQESDTDADNSSHTRRLFPFTGQDHDPFVQNRWIGEAMSHFHIFILILFSFCPHFQRWKCYFYCTFWYLFWIMYCMVVFYMSTGFATWGSGAARAFEIKRFWVNFSQCFQMLTMLILLLHCIGESLLKTRV